MRQRLGRPPEKTWRLVKDYVIREEITPFEASGSPKIALPTLSAPRKTLSVALKLSSVPSETSCYILAAPLGALFRRKASA
ncbi:MAG: hypothetical protein LBC77_06145 [Spirochaetaceae bacterium]|nr:hypothetical protein [Spirochaetaceae bacterium]